jgi:hypothetical protein
METLAGSSGNLERAEIGLVISMDSPPEILVRIRRVPSKLSY